MKYFSLRKNSF